MVFGFILFLYSEMKMRECDRELWKNEQLLKSFNKAKNDNRQHLATSSPGHWWTYIFILLPKMKKLSSIAGALYDAKGFAGISSIVQLIPVI